ncbi:MAG: hypothetical protein IJP78_11080 [Clostridia bacterium]|nr:hypothetical protein [Clostridia bacterium]MBQ6961508.1 hypothetical protein [Clostridia bacterium]
MEINERTKLKDILAAYPWLPEALIQMDGRFRIINSPIGKLLIRTATVGDAAKKAGYPVNQVLDELQKLIAKHEA